MRHPEEGRLNDFVDGVLAPEEAAEVADHLAGCAACAADAAELRRLLAEAGTLPRAVEPERDLWLGIAERLERPSLLDMDTARARRSSGRGASPWPMRVALAAAAGLLVVATSTVTLLVVRGRGEAPVATTTTPAPAAGVGLQLVSEVERGYEGAVNVLESSLAQGRQDLRPETVAIIEENLRIIDEAIASASAALMQDPANVELAQTLRFAYGHKVQLLERAIKLQQI